MSKYKIKFYLDTGYMGGQEEDIIDKPCPHTRDFSHELGHA